MFFARLAIAALSFGSLAQVFAAPIIKDLDTPVPERLPVAHRALDYADALSDAQTILEGVKAQLAAAPIDPANVKPEILESLARVPVALASVSSALKATGADGLANMSADSIASDMAVVMTATASILESVKGIKTLQSLEVIVGNVKDEVNTLLGVVISVFPTVVVLIHTVLAFVHGVLLEFFPVITGVLATALGGGL